MKYEVSIYKHKIPAAILAGLPVVEGATGRYILPTGSLLTASPFNRVLEGIGVDASDVTKSELVEEIFQAFCRRFVGYDVTRELQENPIAPVNKHFVLSTYGAIFKNEVRGTNIAFTGLSDKEIAANMYLVQNGVLPKDVVNFFAPVRARHPRLFDEWTAYNSSILVGESHTATRNREDATTGNASTEDASAEKFNGLSPTTERVNTLVENTSESTDSQSHTENETTATHDVNGIEQKRELAELSSIPSPIAMIMDEIELLFDDNPRTPITCFSGVLEIESEVGV